MIQVGFKTDTGKVRSKNEDSLFVMPEYNVYIVADGVGGHNSGEIASRMAVSNIAEYIKANPVEWIDDDERLKRYFLNCFRRVNEAIYESSLEESQHKGMATTAVVLCLKDGKGYFIHVGDSRSYVIRNGMISQVTQDHTYVNELLKTGTITEEEAKTHPHRNMITRALGGGPTVRPDFYKIRLEPWDVVVLCTDGLYNEVSDEQMCRIAAEEDTMSNLSSKLVELANENGGHDNITVVCLKIGTGGWV